MSNSYSLQSTTPLTASTVITGSIPFTEASHSGSSLGPFRCPLANVQQNNQIVCSGYGPSDEQRKKVEAAVLMGTQMPTVALACVEILFSESELANSNTAGSFSYQKLDDKKIRFLMSVLHQNFDSHSFYEYWENVCMKINSKCRGKRRTVVKRLKQQLGN